MWHDIKIHQLTLRDGYCVHFTDEELYSSASLVLLCLTFRMTPTPFSFLQLNKYLSDAYNITQLQMTQLLFS